MSEQKNTNKEESLSEIVKKFPRNDNSKQEKKGLLYRIASFFFGGWASMFGITKETISSGVNYQNGNNGVNHTSYQRPRPTFKEQQQFDPEKWIIKEMQHEAYNKMVDGKGDHDCEHDH